MIDEDNKELISLLFTFYFFITFDTFFIVFYLLFIIENYSFCAQKDTENDMRFVYCAVAICYILNDFNKIDVKRMLNFIRRSINYDGGIGQGPSLESHGTFHLRIFF